MIKIKTKYLIILLTAFLSKSIIAQNTWSEGINNTKSGQFKCQITKNNISVKKVIDDKRTDLPLIMTEGEDVRCYINSEKEFTSILKETFDNKKLKQLSSKNEKLHFLFTLSKDGEIISITFRLGPNTTINAEEVNYIDTQMKKRVKFKVVRENIPSEPHTNMFYQKIKFEEVLAGEIKRLKEIEIEGKKYW